MTKPIKFKMEIKETEEIDMSLGRIKQFFIPIIIQSNVHLTVFTEQRKDKRRVGMADRRVSNQDSAYWRRVGLIDRRKGDRRQNS